MPLTMSPNSAQTVPTHFAPFRPMLCHSERWSQNMRSNSFVICLHFLAAVQASARQPWFHQSQTEHQLVPGTELLSRCFPQQWNHHFHVCSLPGLRPNLDRAKDLSHTLTHTHHPEPARVHLRFH